MWLPQVPYNNKNYLKLNFTSMLRSLNDCHIINICKLCATCLSSNKTMKLIIIFSTFCSNIYSKTLNTPVIILHVSHSYAPTAHITRHQFHTTFDTWIIEMYATHTKYENTGMSLHCLHIFQIDKNKNNICCHFWFYIHLPAATVIQCRILMGNLLVNGILIL